MKRKMVFACGTPLQVLNAINLKESHFSDYVADLFLCNEFQTAMEMVDRLRETGIFRNIYLISRYKEYPKYLQKIATLKRMFFPYATLKKYSIGGDKIKKEKYGSIVFSFINAFSITIYGMAKADTFIQLEDGMGTYIGNILSDYTSGVFKKIISNSMYKNIANPQKVAVYNPEMYNGNIPVLELKNEFSAEVSKNIERVFAYKANDLYKNNSYIYLTQPLQETVGFNKQKQETINKILEKYKKQLLVRIHPRDAAETYKEFVLDSLKNSWELECIHQIGDNHVLIGGFSTAQLMPKVLKDKEPYIVFLYKTIFEEGVNKNWAEWERFVELFRSFYCKPEKIYVPQSIEEFEEILAHVLKGE